MLCELLIIIKTTSLCVGEKETATPGSAKQEIMKWRKEVSECEIESVGGKGRRKGWRADKGSGGK